MTNLPSNLLSHVTPRTMEQADALAQQAADIAHLDGVQESHVRGRLHSYYFTCESCGTTCITESAAHTAGLIGKHAGHWTRIQYRGLAEQHG